MSRQKSIMRQHERLRVPQGWEEQDKALIIQLNRLLDDIYARFETKYDAKDKADKSEAITNITRSGTTFTATRADGSTFTFTQQDSSYPTAITDITRNGTTFTATRANGTTFTFTQQDNNTTYSAGSGLALNGTEFRVTVPRVAESANHLPGKNSFQLREYTNGTNYNLPTNAWYHIYEAKGSDGAYGTQLALGMTADAAYYRKYASGAWGSWHSLINTDTNTWRGIQNNLTSTSTTDSLSAAQGKNLADNCIKNITRSGTTFTATRYNGGTFTFTQQDNDTNTWRPVHNNLTSTSTTDCLSAYQGKVLNDKLTNQFVSVEKTASVTIGAGNYAVATLNMGRNSAGLISYRPYVNGNLRCFVTNCYYDGTSNNVKVNVSNVSSSSATVTVGCQCIYNKNG